MKEKEKLFFRVSYVALLMFLSCLSCTTVAAATPEAYLQRMTLEQKVGQLMVGFFEGSRLSDGLKAQLAKVHPGGVILYSVSKNVENPRQIAELNLALQNESAKNGDLPLFISIDQEGGRVTRLTQGVTVFPGNMALGASGSERLAAETATVMARELRLLGINMNFAPVMDVNSNPANPVIGIRSFSSDPSLVARLGTAMLEPYSREKVICVAKHFPGHGDTSLDSHLSLPLAAQTREELEKSALPPFYAMIEGGVPAVMTAHIVVPALDASGLPATLSPTVLKMLRQRLGEDGLIITDSLSMGAIDRSWGMDEAAILAFQAGADILLFGADHKHRPEEQIAVHDALLKAVKSGRISVSRLDESVRRIIKAKEKYGILLQKQREPELSGLAAPESLAVALEAARSSITLLRDEEKLLPIPREMKIPLLWPTEYKAALAPLLTICPNLEPHLLPLDAKRSDLPEVLQNAPLIIAASYNLYRNPNWRDLLAALPQKRLIVATMGVPYDLALLPELSSALAVYGDQKVSVKALGEVLYGELRPEGKLPVEME